MRCTYRRNLSVFLDWLAAAFNFQGSPPGRLLSFAPTGLGMTRTRRSLQAKAEAS